MDWLLLWYVVLPTGKTATTAKISASEVEVAAGLRIITFIIKAPILGKIHFTDAFKQ